MGANLQVKQRFFRAWALTFFTALLAAAFPLRAADPAPDAQEILRAVRFSQASQHEALRGQLRHGSEKLKFRLGIDGPTIRYDFTDPPPSSIVLRLLEKDARLSEVTKEGTERVTGKKWSDSVLGTDISFEDISLRFLYWTNAKVEGDENILFRSCWIVSARPPANGDSQYSLVKLWVDKEAGNLMQAEAYDKAGKFLRRFKVVSGQKIQGAWYLKQMRIETRPDRVKDKDPTYLEIEAVEK